MNASISYRFDPQDYSGGMNNNNNDNSQISSYPDYGYDDNDDFRPRGSTLLIKLIMGVIALLLVIVVFAVGTVVFRWQKKLRDDKLFRTKAGLVGSGAGGGGGGGGGGGTGSGGLGLGGFDHVPFTKCPAQV